MIKKGSGILLPISSLPSKYGIGTFGKEAYNFIDFLNETNQKYWQILPIGPVNYGDSPYSSFSVFAGNPYYIDLEILIEEGLITSKDCEVLCSNLDDENNEEYEYIDYEKQFYHRYDILYKAYKKSKLKLDSELKEFIKINSWVCDYSLFMALKYHFNQRPWYEWEESIKNRTKIALLKYKTMLSEEIQFWTFLQYIFYNQYFKLKSYANMKEVQIIGDMPIYPAMDSVEVWAERNLFINDENNNISLVAGVPPDAFSETGQLWGNPVYNWGYLKKHNYQWWISRLEHSMKLYDVVRIDHFRGFDEFWAVPKESTNAVNGKWLPANGREMFKQAIKMLGNINIIAEDLGIITDSVVKLKDEFSFPGMKVFQFAFDGNPNNPYLPKNYDGNCVVYTGTHDNDTLKGWFSSLSIETKKYVLKTLEIDENINDECKTIELIINIILKSNALITIIPLQDYLCLDSVARINIPSTIGNNWRWRTRNFNYKEI